MQRCTRAYEGEVIVAVKSLWTLRLGRKKKFLQFQFSSVLFACKIVFSSVSEVSWQELVWTETFRRTWFSSENSFFDKLAGNIHQNSVILKCFAFNFYFGIRIQYFGSAKRDKLLWNDTREVKVRAHVVLSRTRSRHCSSYSGWS